VIDRIRISVELSEQDFERIAERAAALAAARLEGANSSPYVSIPEAAELLRCRRQRVDDLLCQRRLTRVKDGSRTLIRRAELEAYLRGEPTGAWAARSPLR
jgi:excisionase family DNA binding protein